MFKYSIRNILTDSSRPSAGIFAAELINLRSLMADIPEDGTCVRI